MSNPKKTSRGRPDTNISSSLNSLEITEATEANPLEKDATATEGPGNLNGTINNTAIELQSSVDLDVDEFQSHGNSGHEATV